MFKTQSSMLALLAALAATPASANVVTDWDTTGVALIQGNAPFPPPRVGGATGGQRIITIMHLAMFEAVNSIDPHYRPFSGDPKPKIDASLDAAAASAAATVLTKLDPTNVSKFKEALDKSLAAIPDGDAKTRGIKLGEESAAAIIKIRTDDGNDLPNAYRPITQPGVYTQTMVTAGWENVHMTPFGMKSPDQFRPPPPIALTSEEYAKNYNEMKDIGEKNSKTRTPEQTANARFWLTVIPLSHSTLVRQVAIDKGMSVVDTARFMALANMAAMDAVIAVMDAKYQYNFWRPITAIRNGDIDDNPATERVATWQPIDITPMHPEYPCAHCIITGSVASAMAQMLGTEQIPEVTLTAPSAPGVTRKYTNVRDFNKDAMDGRIAAGFHWRFSTVVGSDMGWKIGANTVQNCMQPLKVASR